MYFYGMIIVVYALHQVMITAPIRTTILKLSLLCTNVSLKLNIFYIMDERGDIK